VFLDAKKERPELVTITNTPIPFSSGPYAGSSLTPDFALSTRTSNSGVKYSIFVESAYAQPLKDLKIVAKKHLTLPEVACVIGINFHTPSLNSPSASTAVPPISYESFQAEAPVSIKGGVMFRGTRWAPPINRIEMTAWLKRKDTASYILFHLPEVPKQSRPQLTSIEDVTWVAFSRTRPKKNKSSRDEIK
jgi:hypothetical protein